MIDFKAYELVPDRRFSMGYRHVPIDVHEIIPYHKLVEKLRARFGVNFRNVEIVAVDAENNFGCVVHAACPRRMEQSPEFLREVTRNRLWAVSRVFRRLTS